MRCSLEMALVLVSEVYFDVSLKICVLSFYLFYWFLLDVDRVEAFLETFLDSFLNVLGTNL